MREFRIVTESLGMAAKASPRGSIEGGEERTQDGALWDFNVGW